MQLPSSLIVDANILFSFFKKDSTRKFILNKLLKKGVTINIPYLVFLELSNNKDKIIKYSHISSTDFIMLLSILNKRLNIFSEEDFSEYLKEALKIVPDKKDIEYFALSLSLNNCPIWSDEKSFLKQKEIKIFSTKELLDVFSK